MKKDLSLFDQHSSKRKSRVECLDEPQTKQIHSSHLVRIICVILAVLCIFAAIIGVVLPGIPTFDFLFLATFFCLKRLNEITSLASSKPLYASFNGAVSGWF